MKAQYNENKLRNLLESFTGDCNCDIEFFCYEWNLCRKEADEYIRLASNDFYEEFGEMPKFSK